MTTPPPPTIPPHGAPSVSRDARHNRRPTSCACWSCASRIAERSIGEPETAGFAAHFITTSTHPARAPRHDSAGAALHAPQGDSAPCLI